MLALCQAGLNTACRTCYREQKQYVLSCFKTHLQRFIWHSGPKKGKNAESSFYCTKVWHPCRPIRGAQKLSLALKGPRQVSILGGYCHVECLPDARYKYLVDIYRFGADPPASGTALTAAVKESRPIQDNGSKSTAKAERQTSKAKQAYLFLSLCTDGRCASCVP